VLCLKYEVLTTRTRARTLESTRKAENAKPIGRLMLLSKVAAGNRELMGLSLRVAGTTLPLHARKTSI